MRKYRSSRSRPSRSAASRSMLVAQIRRKSTLTVPLAADRPVLALLQHAQQLGLQERRHLADLVEHQRAAARQLEQADLVLQRAGERALLVAEELRLDQVLRNRRAVDLDERALGAQAAQVQRVGDQFLAGAVLALDQDVGVARRHRFDELEELAHLLALADDVREGILAADLLAELRVLPTLVVQRNGAFENRGDAGRDRDRTSRGSRTRRPARPRARA